LSIENDALRVLSFHVSRTTSDEERRSAGEECGRVNIPIMIDAAQQRGEKDE